MDFIFIIAILIMSIVVHEVSHGFMALWLGDKTAQYEGRLNFNPLKHLDPVGSVLVPMMGYLFGGIIIGWAKPVPFNPYNLRNQRWGEALVALAGPLSNIILAVIFSILIRFSISQGFATQSFVYLSSYLVFINIVLCLFNLVPIPPLDGSKILFSIFPNSFRRGLVYLESYGFVLVLLFIFLFWGSISPLARYLFTLLTGQSF
jgi:Zn-dependent protease